MRNIAPSKFGQTGLNNTSEFRKSGMNLHQTFGTKN
jgi:hypothetical protein